MHGGDDELRPGNEAVLHQVVVDQRSLRRLHQSKAFPVVGCVSDIGILIVRRACRDLDGPLQRMDQLDAPRQVEQKDGVGWLTKAILEAGKELAGRWGAHLLSQIDARQAVGPHDVALVAGVA